MPSIQIDMIRRDGGTQMRVELNEETALSYMERLEAGDAFPPVEVFYDGAAYWLTDGFHRIDAHFRLRSKHIGTPEAERWSSISAEVRHGDLNAAIWAAIGANKTNGLRRTNRDKQTAVRAALALPDAIGLSDQAIAEQAGVSAEMVRKARAAQVPTVGTCTQVTESPSEFAGVSSDTSRTKKRRGVDGKTYSKASHARKPGRPEKPDRQSDEEKRAKDRARMERKRAEKRAAAVKDRRCPMCNGKGTIS